MRHFNLKSACLAVLFASVAAQAQTQRPSPVVSPDVHPDHTVTFRVKAPKAAEVTLTGDWLGSAPAPKLTKGEQGVWSITLGPLEPSSYISSFTVDGMAIADPINPRMKLRASTSASLVEVPAEPASSPADAAWRGDQLGEIQSHSRRDAADLGVHATGL